MKKHLVILSGLILIVTAAHSQDVLGKWYGINENYLAELIIDNDSIKIQILDSRGADAGRERRNFKHSGIYEIGNKSLVVVTDYASEEGYLAMTFCNIQRNQSIELAANIEVKQAKTIGELTDAIGKDRTELFGNIFYDEAKIQEFEKLKDLETMPVEDFRLYLKKFIEKRDANFFMEEMMPGTFRERMVNETLLEIGYNPLFRKDWENRFFEKYLSDKEVGKIYRERYWPR